MYSALAHDFVGFLARVWPPQYSSPSLCEQSELQCCASDLHRMFARCPLQRRNRHAIWLKTVLIGSSVLAAEICTGPHNRLLRRQHCSSLCSQSEGHEHVANMASALGHDFVGFLAVYSRHNIRGPHFACKVSYSASPQTFAECSRDAPCS